MAKINSAIVITILHSKIAKNTANNIKNSTISIFKAFIILIDSFEKL